MTLIPCRWITIGRKRGALIVYKNLTSGKGFIFLEQTGNNEVLFITPPNEKGEVAVKSLRFNLFAEEFIEDEEKKFLSSEVITKEQFLRLQQFDKDRSEERVENVKDAFEQLTPWQKKNLIEELLKGK
jgi:hypothetical protein